ncbi:MAG: hypothetical protein F4169_06545 [Gammaproteobacteria bacterium]|nr:hypothetical protein [Gammaproteobacteria bacterium]
MEPLKLTEVLKDDVGRPRNDGTRGSALYAVPIGLNRTPDSVEAQLLVQHWDSPPRFTSRHRPGILRVLDDRVILERTTIDEIESCHAETLRLVIEQTNADAASYRESQRKRADAQACRDHEHDDHVREVAARIQF